MLICNCRQLVCVGGGGGGGGGAAYLVFCGGESCFFSFFYRDRSGVSAAQRFHRGLPCFFSARSKFGSSHSLVIKSYRSSLYARATGLSIGLTLSKTALPVRGQITWNC